MAQKLAFKARRTPSSIHPPAPPQIPLQIESMYYAVDEELLGRAIAPYKESIVTRQTLYKPGLLAMARVIFEGTRWGIYHERDVVRVIPYPAPSQTADWRQNQIQRWENGKIRSDAEGVSFYMVDSTYEFSQERFDELQDDFINHLISSEILELDYNPTLKIHRKLDEQADQFHVRCMENLRERYSQEYQQLLDSLSRQEDRLKEKLEREFREHGNPQETAAELRNAGIESNQQQMDTHGAMVDLKDIHRELGEIQKTRESKLMEFEETLQQLCCQLEKDILRVNRGNVKILRFALVWLPFTEFVIQEGETRRMEVIKSF